MSMFPEPTVAAQRWEDVPEYLVALFARDLKRHCHVCSGTEQVKEGIVPLTACAMTRRVVMGTSYWRLCQSCYDQGWRPPTEHFNRLSYTRLANGKFETKNAR